MRRAFNMREITALLWDRELRCGLAMLRTAVIIEARGLR
jgi:hypothetical protein